MYAVKLLATVSQPSLNMRMVLPAVKYGSKKVEDVPEQPKRPLSPYMGYYVKNFAKERAANPQLKIADLARHVASKWALENKELKTKMMAEYVESLSKYYEANQNYQLKLSPEKLAEIKENKAEMKRKKEKKELKKALEENNKPKRPATSFGMFLKDRIEAYGAKRPSGKPTLVTEITTKLANEWKNLSPEAKQKYTDVFQKNTEEYKKKLAQWEDEMVRQGKGWLLKPTLRVDQPLEDKKKQNRKKQTSTD